LSQKALLERLNCLLTTKEGKRTAVMGLFEPGWPGLLNFNNYNNLIMVKLQLFSEKLQLFNNIFLDVGLMTSYHPSVAFPS
jgi:hypothetical protein